MVTGPSDLVFLKTEIANPQFPTIKTDNCCNFREKVSKKIGMYIHNWSKPVKF
jgi:hypothetical protein